MRISRPAIAILIVVLAAVYGAADQFLGSRSELGEWTVAERQTVSALYSQVVVITSRHG